MTTSPVSTSGGDRALGVARISATAVVLGAAVGLVCVAFLGAEKLLRDLLWERLWEAVPWLADHRAVATVLLCTTGGVVVGLVNRGRAAGTHQAEPAHDLDDALASSHQEAPSTAGVLRLAVLGVVSLAFAGSLGPEAPLIAVVAALAARLGHVLRLTRDEAVDLSVAGALGGLFGAPLGAVAIPLESGDPTGLRARIGRIGPNLLAAVAGLTVLLAVLPEGSFHRFDLEADPDGGTGWVLLPALAAALIGAAAGAVLLRGLPVLQRRAARLAPALVLRAAMGGLVLGLCGAVTPLALFSGHAEMQQLFDELGERSAAVLLGIAAVKVVAVLACLATGWFGGEVFPAAMVGTTLALAVAEVGGTEGTAAVAAAGMVAAAAVALHRPVAALLLFVFFIPAGTLVAAALGAAVGAAVLSALSQHPRPESPEATPPA